MAGALYVVRALLRKGANPNYRDEEGLNALHLTARAKNTHDIFNRPDGQVLKDLIEHGADVFASGEDCGRTVLHFAAR